MKCKIVANVMSDYLDEKLSGHERLEFELHIEKCDNCADKLAAIEKMLLSLGALGSLRSPVDCWIGVRSLVRERPHTHWYRHFLRPLVALPALSLPVLAYILLTLPPAIDTSRPERNMISIPEYSNYLTAHSRAQRLEPFSDPDVALVAAELEKASLTTDSAQ